MSIESSMSRHRSKNFISINFYRLYKKKKIEQGQIKTSTPTIIHPLYLSSNTEVCIFH